MTDSWSGELPGVQVGDVLHDLLKALNVISLQAQRGLVGIKLHLEKDRETYIHISTSAVIVKKIKKKKMLLWQEFEFLIFLYCKNFTVSLQMNVETMASFYK